MLKTKFRTTLVLGIIFALICGGIIAYGRDAIECTTDVILYD